MFRIHFNPKLGRFLIQVCILHTFWSSIKAPNSDKSGYDVMTFETFDGAVAHTKLIGLDKLYRDHSDNKFRDHMSYGIVDTKHGFIRQVDTERGVVEYREFGRSQNNGS